VCNELERIRKEVLVAYFEELSRRLPRGTEESYEQPHSRKPVSRPKLQGGTFRIRSRGANHSAMTFSD
jgi:hypothetical protein